jgi:hypothetical protein
VLVGRSHSCSGPSFDLHRGISAAAGVGPSRLSNAARTQPGAGGTSVSAAASSAEAALPPAVEDTAGLGTADAHSLRNSFTLNPNPQQRPAPASRAPGCRTISRKLEGGRGPVGGGARLAGVPEAQHASGRHPGRTRHRAAPDVAAPFAYSSPRGGALLPCCM